MSIKKNTPEYLKHSRKSFTTIQNSTIELIKDPATLGIYVYLASKPDDWEISEKNLQNRFGKCRDFIRSRFSQLKKIGLMESIPVKNERGVIQYWETVLYNEAQNPIDKSSDKSTVLENQDSGESTVLENQDSGESTVLEIQMTGKARHLVKPPTTNKRNIKIKEETKIERRARSVFEKDEKEVGHQETYYQTQNEVVEKKQDEELIQEILNCNPFNIDEISIRAWYQNRKQAKKPVNAGVWALMIKQLYKYLENRLNPKEKFETMALNGWLGLDIKKELQNLSGKKGNSQSFGWLHNGLGR